MIFNLKKGEKKTISQPVFSISLSWDPNNSTTGTKHDLDVSVFLLGSNGQLNRTEDLIFYNNNSSLCGSIVHSGDCTDGNSDTSEDVADERVEVNLSTLDPSIKEICVVVTIDKADERRQNFGQVRNSLIRIHNDSDPSFDEIRYELDEDYSIETSMLVGRVYERNGEWKFDAVGSGERLGLDAYVSRYAPNAEFK